MTVNQKPSSNLEFQTPKILVAMSGFKGSLTNLQACESVSKALEELKLPHTLLPVGDGGSGTGLALKMALGGEEVSIHSVDPSGRAVLANILCLPNSQAPTKLYIESSGVCGFTLIKEKGKNALEASSRGLGVLLKTSLQRWKSTLKEVWVGLGDSAISDVGVGMLSELGVSFFNSQGKPFSASTKNLIEIADFSKPQVLLNEISLTVLCDVSNPLCGPQGSAVTFSPQKGASRDEVLLIAKGMDHFASRIENKFNRSLKYLPMTGSAGGLSAAFLSFFNAKLVPGCSFLLDQIGFDEKISHHSLVVTGEGRTDSQTLQRKAPAVIADRAKKVGTSCLFIAGSLGASTDQIATDLNLIGLYECGQNPSAEEALKRKTIQVFSNFKIKHQQKS